MWRLVSPTGTYTRSTALCHARGVILSRGAWLYRTHGKRVGYHGRAGQPSTGVFVALLAVYADCFICRVLVLRSVLADICPVMLSTVLGLAPVSFSVVYR